MMTTSQDVGTKKNLDFEKKDGGPESDGWAI